VGTPARRVKSLRQRLNRNSAHLVVAFRELAKAAKHGQQITSAGEWFLDNFHIVEEQIRKAQGDLPADFYNELPKLTGGPELQVMVPIEPELSWQEARCYSEQIAARLAGSAIDCRYNARDSAAIGAWSPRMLPGFPLAAPLDWKQLRQGRPDAFTLQHRMKKRA